MPSYYCNRDISCTGINSKNYLDITVLLTCTCSNGIIQVTLSSALSPANISFIINSIQNPPSTASATQFYISTKNNGFYIEQSFSLSVAVTIPAVLTITEIDISSTTVSANTDYYFYVSCESALASSYQMTIIFPTDFTISPSVKINGFISIIGTVTISISSNTITVLKGFKQYTALGSDIEFDVNGIINPYSTKSSQGINMTITTSNNDAVCSSSIGYSITATVGSFSGISIIPTDSTIYLTTIYTFTMTLNSIVQSTGYLQIIFPSEISIAPRSTSNCTNIITGLSIQTECAIFGSTLTLTNCFSSNFSGKISFSIDQVTNPISCAKTGVFKIRAYSNDNYLILYDNSSTISATPGTLQSAAINYQSFITGYRTSYTFSVNVAHKVPSGGIFYLILPSQISFNSPSCSNALGFSVGYSCVFNSTTLTISNGFANNFLSGTLQITIVGMKNPGTTQTSDSFQLYTYSNSYIIDELNSGLTATMTTPNNFTNASVFSSSNIVGGFGDFSFMITPCNPMYSSGIIRIILPSQIQIPSFPVCTPLGSTVTTSCNLSGNVLEANVIFKTYTVISNFGFVVKNCQNPKSTMPSDSFQAYDYINGYSIDELTSGITIMAATPGNLAVNISLTDYGISVIANYTFIIATSNPIPAMGFFLIVFPSAITISKTPICSAVVSCS